jgi:hypothetical protein
VKTAISVPDEAFRRVERHAARLRISRSEFFTRAAERWAEELEREDLTSAVNVALDLAGEGDQDDGAAFFHEAARRAFLREDS